MAPLAEEGCKLFVYGVANQTPREELQNEFEKFGIVTDAYNSGKGYAFITFEKKEEADEAREKLNGANVCGQEIKVDVAKPRGAGAPRGMGRGGPRGRGRGGGERGGGYMGGDRGGRGGGRGGERGGYGGRGRGGGLGGNGGGPDRIRRGGGYRGGPGGQGRGGGYRGGRGGGGGQERRIDSEGFQMQ